MVPGVGMGMDLLPRLQAPQGGPAVLPAREGDLVGLAVRKRDGFFDSVDLHGISFT
jgi:hypothetical protein